MTTVFQKAIRHVGGAALASVLLASCSQDWTASDVFSSTDKARKSVYEIGKMQMSAGHYGLAVQSFRKALSDQPQSVKVLNALAATYDLLGRFDLAERYYRQALNFDPRSVQTLNNFGYSYFLRGQHDQANVLFEKAARIDGKNPVVAANLAALAKAGMARQAAAAAQKQERDSRPDSQPLSTTWIERSGRITQSLVTEPDEAMLKKAREQGVEPRLVHAPRPLIEITTVEPSLEKVTKPRTQPNPLKVEGTPKQGVELRVVHTPRALIELETNAPSLQKIAKPQTEPATNDLASDHPPTSGNPRQAASAESPRPVMAKAVRSSSEIDQAKARVDDGFRFAPMGSVISKELGLQSYPLLAQPQESGSSIGGVGATQMEDLPKLREDIARDVKEAATNLEKAAATEASRPLPVDPVAPREDGETQNMTAPDGAMDKAAKGLEAGEGANSVEAHMQASGKRAGEEEISKPAFFMTAVPRAVGKDGGSVEVASLTGEDKATRQAEDTKGAKPASAPMAKQQDLEALKQAARLEISNGTGRLRMARRMSYHLVSLGIATARLTNAKSYSNMVSVLHFRPGQISKAMMLSDILPVSPKLRRNADLKTDLRLVLGGDLLNFDRQLISRVKK